MTKISKAGLTLLKIAIPLSALALLYAIYNKETNPYEQQRVYNRFKMNQMIKNQRNPYV